MIIEKLEAIKKLFEEKLIERQSSNIFLSKDGEGQEKHMYEGSGYEVNISTSIDKQGEQRFILDITYNKPEVEEVMLEQDNYDRGYDLYNKPKDNMNMKKIFY